MSEQKIIAKQCFMCYNEMRYIFFDIKRFWGENMIYINFDRSSSEPLYIQAFNRLADKINHGEILSGTKLPSQRQMAKQLNVSVNTITNAYNMLVQYGYVSSTERSGYYVNNVIDPTDNATDKLWKSDVPCTYNFSRNGVDLTVPLSFRRTFKYCSKTFVDDTFSYPDYTGTYDLRKQISSMLSKTQGISCSPTQIILGTSFEQLVGSLLTVLGRDLVVGMENPAYIKPAQYLMLSCSKLKYLNIPAGGINEEILKDFDADILLLMPYHHYPLYYTMTTEQKQAVLDWAGSRRYIIEYGYDMDLMYDTPTESMFSMSENKNVIFAGDFKRTISPSVNAAYLVLPEQTVSLWQQKYYTYHSSVSIIEQNFISEIIKNNSYYSNIKRLKNLYKNKSRLLVDTIKEHPLGERVNVLHSGCGTTVVIQPEIPVPEDRLLIAAHENGVKISYIKNALENPNPLIPPNLFILGFGELSKEEITKGAGILLDVWTSLLP